jgi:hypothetical protein
MIKAILKVTGIIFLITGFVFFFISIWMDDPIMYAPDRATTAFKFFASGFLLFFTGFILTLVTTEDGL